MRRFHREFGLKKARILRERLIPVSKGLKIGINRHPLSFSVYTFRFIVILKSGMQSALSGLHTQTVFFMAFKNRFTRSEGSGE